MSRQYVTTAIDYPNAAPHMGHVLEKVLADVIVRWFRLRGDQVRFQIGTDEHGIKIQQTAKKEGIEPRALVDRNVRLFEDLYGRLGISADVFIRTSNKEVHWPTVKELWKRLDAAKMLEQRTYAGLYCTGCERFVTEKDLVDGKCPDHNIEPQKVEEKNWFFLLSKETGWLKKLLKKDYRIVPSFRETETLKLLEQGLDDVSFSRPKSSLSWGIPVPDDEEQTMYVWCDALTNYISGLGYFTPAEDRKWWDDATVTHVIGKDIARFHALIWPAMLKAAGTRTPDRLLIHGFLTSEGQKMSKSLGNVVVPKDVIEKYGVEALRFYLSHEIPVGNDGDFSWKRFGELYDAKLRNQLGNLLNRILTLLKKEGGKIAISDAPEADSIKGIWKEYRKHIDAFELSDALQVAMKLVDSMNARMNEVQPWKLAGEEKLKVLSTFAEQLRHVSLMLLPFIPDTAKEMSTQLGVPYAVSMGDRQFTLEEVTGWNTAQDWNAIGEPKILFAPIE